MNKRNIGSTWQNKKAIALNRNPNFKKTQLKHHKDGTNTEGCIKREFRKFLQRKQQHKLELNSCSQQKLETVNETDIGSIWQNKKAIIS